MNEQQNYIILSAFIVLIGVVLRFLPLITDRRPTEINKKNTETKTCSFCAETIKKEAIICRFCNRDIATKTQPQIQITENQNITIKEKTTDLCPKCSHKRAGDSQECPNCGIIFAKL